MEFDVARANWERMTPEQRLPVISEILPLARGQTPDQETGYVGLANQFYDELPEDVRWDLCLAADEEGFSTKTWLGRYKQTEGQTG